MAGRPKNLSYKQAYTWTVLSLGFLCFLVCGGSARAALQVNCFHESYLSLNHLQLISSNMECASGGVLELGPDLMIAPGASLQAIAGETRLFTGFQVEQGGSFRIAALNQTILAIPLHETTEEDTVTHFLLQGLKGSADYNGDNSVTLGELIPYLSEHVRRETRNAQSPTVSGRFDPALSIGGL